jgi:CRP-like cAMP-binding protein
MRKALYILGILDDTDVSWLAMTGKSRSIAPGTVIIQRGVPMDSLFILIDGQLQVYSGSVEIARLSAGEIVGEISFVDARPPSASVKATVESQVLAVPKSALYAKLQKDLGFASRFYFSVATFLAERLRASTARLSASEAEADGHPGEDLDELHSDMLENIALASARFDMIIKRLGVQPTGKGS